MKNGTPRSKTKGLAWLEETDNATHFKSKENLLFWSERPSKYKEFIKMVWVEYGCPGHGKGPWDGLGAMAKTKVTRDLTDGNVQTPSGRITSPLEVAQHLRAQFCSRQWKKERMNMKINQVVVMYLDADEIVRPARAQWSTEEDAHMRPGHHWLCEFGDVGNVTSCERQFNLGHHQCEDYRGTRFYN